MAANKEGDKFGIDSQLNARRDGTYWQKAAEIEVGRCVFCDLRDKYIIKTSKYGSLTVNIFPYIDGQLLVIPHRHLENFSDLSNEESQDLQQLNQEGVLLLKEVMGIDNIWIILRDGNLAGKTIKHLHWNIMPYIEGLHTWNYDAVTLTVKPVDLAAKLRDAIK